MCSVSQRWNSKLETFGLPFQEINLIDPDRFLVAIERNHDSQPDRRFRRGDYDDKHSENLAGNCVHVAGVLQVPRESNEVQIRGVQNQLDRHEDDDDVAPREHSGDADDEEQRADNQKLRQIRVLCTFAASARRPVRSAS